VKPVKAKTATRKRVIRESTSPSPSPSSSRPHKMPRISQHSVVKSTPNRRQLSAIEVIDVDAICTSLKESHQDIAEDILKSICSDVIMITHDRY